MKIQISKVVQDPFEVEFFGRIPDWKKGQVYELIWALRKKQRKNPGLNWIVRTGEKI